MDNIKLKINISNKEPIDLINLTIGLNSFAKLYSDFNNGDSQAKLLVKEIRKGSIEIDLISLCVVSAIPLISDVNNIVQFCHYIKLLIGITTEAKQEEVKQIIADNYLPSPKIKDFKNFKDTVNITGGAEDVFKMEAINTENGNVYIGSSFDGIQSVKIKDSIDKIVKEKEANTEYNKQLFRWVQTNFDNSKQGNKGRIEKITKEPLRVTFDNDEIKNEMTTSNDGVEWQNKYYIVNVEILTSDGSPKMYKILKNYPSESFPIDE
jgi:hypothetical protein